MHFSKRLALFNRKYTRTITTWGTNSKTGTFKTRSKLGNEAMKSEIVIEGDSNARPDNQEAR